MIALDRLAEAPTGLLLVLKATAVLAAAWLAHGALARANPRWRVLAWRGATLGLAAVAALAFAPPLVTWRVAAPATATEPAPTIAPTPIPIPRPPARPPVSESAEAPAPAPAANPEPPRAAVRIASPTPAEPIDPAAALAAVWLAGVAVGLARLVFGAWRLSRVVRRTEGASGSVLAACRATAEGLGIRRRVRVVVAPGSPRPAWPACCGRRSCSRRGWGSTRRGPTWTRCSSTSRPTSATAT